MTSMQYRRSVDSMIDALRFFSGASDPVAVEDWELKSSKDEGPPDVGPQESGARISFLPLFSQLSAPT